MPPCFSPPMFLNGGATPSARRGPHRRIAASTEMFVALRSRRGLDDGARPGIRRTMSSSARLAVRTTRSTVDLHLAPGPADDILADRPLETGRTARRLTRRVFCAGQIDRGDQWPRPFFVQTLITTAAPVIAIP